MTEFLHTCCRHIGQSHPEMLSAVISCLNPVLSGLYYPQRVMATAVFGEVVQLLIISICMYMSVCYLHRCHTFVVPHLIFVLVYLFLNVLAP